MVEVLFSECFVVVVLFRYVRLYRGCGCEEVD